MKGGSACPFWPDQQLCYPLTELIYAVELVYPNSLWSDSADAHAALGLYWLRKRYFPTLYIIPASFCCVIQFLSKLKIRCFFLSEKYWCFLIPQQNVCCVFSLESPLINNVIFVENNKLWKITMATVTQRRYPNNIMLPIGIAPLIWSDVPTIISQ